MPTPINNLALESLSSVDGKYQVTLSFDTIPLYVYIGAYKLYKSYSLHDSGVFTSIIVERSSIYTESVNKTYSKDNKTFLDYYIDEEDYGRVIYLHLVPISRTWITFVSSSKISIKVPPTEPEFVVAKFNNYEVFLTWAPPVGAINSNVDVTHYNIKRANSTELTGFSLNTSGNLSHSSFYKGAHVFVVDYIHKLYWYGVCAINGEFLLNEETRFSLVNEDIGESDVSINNLKIYIENVFTQIGEVANSTFLFNDTSYNKDFLYFYSISASVQDAEGPSVYYPLFTTPLPQVYPYLRSWKTSENSFISSPFWSKLKHVLTDHNYYNKQSFDIPRIKGMYAFTGFLGLSDCKVDIFVNDVYTASCLSNQYGGFAFSVHLPGTICKLHMQARDRGNIGFSIKSTPQIIRLVNIYSFFTALGKEYSDIWQELLAQMKDFSYDTSRIQLLENKLQPYVDLVHNISETDENFTKLVTQAYLAYEYAGYQESIYLLLNAMKDTIAELDHYDVFFRDAPMQTIHSGYSYIINDEEAQLPREDYVYAVTAVNIYDEETAPAIIRVDNRWWPTNLKNAGIETSTGFLGYNVLTWEPSVGGSLTNRILIVTSYLPRGEMGVLYDQTLVTRGGTPPFTFSVYSGSLGNGISLDTSTGRISGVVTALGNLQFVIRCTDFVGDYFDRTLLIEIPSVCTAIDLVTSPIIIETAAVTAIVNYVARDLILEFPRLGYPFCEFIASGIAIDLVTHPVYLGQPTASFFTHGAAIDLIINNPILEQPILHNISSLEGMDLILELPELSSPALHLYSSLNSQDLILLNPVLSVPDFSFEYHINGGVVGDVDTAVFDEGGPSDVLTNLEFDGGVI